MEIHLFKTFLERYSKQKINQWGHLSPFRISIRNLSNRFYKSRKPIKPVLKVEVHQNLVRVLLKLNKMFAFLPSLTLIWGFPIFHREVF